MSTLLRAIREDIPLNLYRVKSPGIARVVANVRLTPAGHDDVRHIVLDLSGLHYRYLEGQSLGVLVPGVDGRGHPHKLRLYSFASSRRGDDGCGNTASICVKRVVYNDPVTGMERRGVASNYLCDLKPGDEVAVTGPAGKILLLPEDPAANLVLVATGTGIAPFRAFLRRLYHDHDHDCNHNGDRLAWNGSIVLFSGVKTEAECLYRDEIDAFLSRPNFRRVYAFSREQKTAEGQRMYVQHRMAEHLDELRTLLARDNGYLYICGLKGMEVGIASVLGEPGPGASNSPISFEALEARRRLFIEVY
jgi:ferredoxin--NADP+ reductase